MNHLEHLEAQSIYILREARSQLHNLVILWSVGKDSNVLLWLARKAFFGRVPFPVALLDTGNEFPEVYALRDRLSEAWALDCLNAPCPFEETDPLLPPNARAAARKTLGLRRLIAEHRFDGVVVGIRRDEQSVRGKERVFSARDAAGEWHPHAQPAEFWDHFATEPPSGGHLRIHPLLDWTELDIWRYIAREGVPVSELYFARDGMRFSSLGEADITRPVPSTAGSIEAIIAELESTRQPERAGRTMDRESEDAFERLRAAGYM